MLSKIAVKNYQDFSVALS